MSFTHENFAQVLSKYQYNFHAGDIIAGSIFSKEYGGFLVDIGNHTAGYLPEAELFLAQISYESVNLHETREFFILAHDLESKQLILSIKRLTYIRAWERIKQLRDENIIIEASIKGINKGGIIIEIEGIQGFIPNSHLCYSNIGKDNLINTVIECKFLMADEQTNKLVLSNRCAVIERLITKIKIGSTVQADVMDITDFGVFFNVYSIPALLHKSEINEMYAQNMQKFFPTGKNWLIKIMHIDTKQGRISVSISSNIR
uniref:ribosomal protein S1 n=1 Tax=Nemalion vermiculare TaxID=935621 RepID=UPI00257A17BF|nr:ribosomal protein S1 [Nemalion vermiculare]WGV34362.1 ribosomal protein S1 [Nemalion vermiculare]